jgi:opacity protein-like surface antigen
MRWAVAIAFGSLLLCGAAYAREQENPDKQYKFFIERGPYVALMLNGSELDGPKPTADTDVSFFRGLGFSGAVGYRWLPLRAEIEYLANTAYGEGGYGDDDRVELRTLMLNVLAEAQVASWFGLFAGAGFGQAKVKADFVTCLQYPGCPSFAPSHTSGSASARQLQLGITVGPPNSHQFVLGVRWLKSGSLGLADTQGRPFGVDKADYFLAIFGWRGNF